VHAKPRARPAQLLTAQALTDNLPYSAWNSWWRLIQHINSAGGGVTTGPTNRIFRFDQERGPPADDKFFSFRCPRGMLVEPRNNPWRISSSNTRTGRGRFVSSGPPPRAKRNCATATVNQASYSTR